jgi:hypothetical protein
MADPILYRQRRRGKDGAIIMLSTIVRRVPTQDELKALYLYNPETGHFTHLKSRGKGRAGQTAGNVNANGYVEMRVMNRLFHAHRLAWLYMTGSFPEIPLTVDHINGVRTDNRWGNLRVANWNQQSWNAPAHHHNKSGLKGAWPCRQTGRWVSMLQDGKRRIWLGRFDTAEEAHRAWVKAATELRGEEWIRRAISHD